MKNYIRNGARILYNYVLSLIVFAVFIYVFLTAAGENFGKMLPLYSFLNFLIAFYLVYMESKKQAAKEKRPQYGLHPYPLKGLIYGIIGFLPVAVLEIVSVFLHFGSELADRMKHVAVNTMMGPLFFIIKIFDERPEGYIIASLVIPVVAMLGYMAGYYGFDLIRRIKKEESKPKKKFEKSPWNPSNKAGTASGKKKKTKQTTKSV